MAIFLATAVPSHARWMNPQTGRFHTMDTYDGDKRDPASLHKYVYAANNPVNNVDPSGEDYETIGVLTTMSIASAGFAQTTGASSLGGIYAVAWGASRALTAAEIDLARTIYKGNIVYPQTGVDYGKYAFAGIRFQPTGREMTPDGIIHTGGETIKDYTVSGAKPNWPYGLLRQKGIVIHELCHVWQYQQSGSLVLRGLYRNYNYAGPNFGSLAFSDYGIEQQAQMTEDYFYLRNGDSSSSTIPAPVPRLATYEKILPFLK